MQTGEPNSGTPPNSFTPVVVTGMGLATSLGHDVHSTWTRIREGHIGLGPMDAMESALPSGAMGGQAVDLPSCFAPGLPRESRYLRWVIEQALRNAGTVGARYARGRCAVLLGTTLHGIRAGGRFLREHDPAALRHFLANAVTRNATLGLGLDGPTVTTCSACSSSLGAIALGVTMLQARQADLVVAGGYDAVSEYAWGGFNSLRLVASSAVMPFARQRQGMVPAEGYGVVVMERAEDAGKRGAETLVVVQGWGESADAHHLTQPDPQGTGAARAIRAALARAGAGPSDISMITAHATGTSDNDAAEYAAFHAVFGDALANTPVVGFKSYLGHTLGGAGAVELVLSACALQAGWVPPCANVRQEDVEFAGLSVAPPGGLERRITRTLNSSLGFGGANTCLILGRSPEGQVDVHVPPAVVLRERPDVWITGFGLVLPGITGTSELLNAIERTEGALVPQGEPTRVRDEQLASILNVRRLRRQSEYVKLMLASVALAIRHAGLEGSTERLAPANAILASTHGASGFCSEYYTQLVREGVLNANPVLFAEGVPNASAAHVSTMFGVRGSCQTIIGSRTAGLNALGLAATRIWTGASETVIVGAAEETHASVDLAYRHAGLFQAAGPAPGCLITPGSVALIVESSASATARGATPLAVITRWAGVSPPGALRGSAAHTGDASAPWRALVQVGAQGAVLGSGNGTWIDRAEAIAVRRLPGTTLVESLHNRVGDLFAAGPLLALVRAIAQASLTSMTSLCTDFTGTATAVTIDRSGLQCASKM